MNQRSKSRSAARLAAVQALYQKDMEGTPLPVLLHEFHEHRLGKTIEDVTYADAERDFFDDIVAGVDKRRAEIDALIEGRLAKGWSLARLDKPMHQILRAGSYELRSEEHTSELQSLMRISYAVLCLKKKKQRYVRVES